MPFIGPKYRLGGETFHALDHDGPSWGSAFPGGRRVVRFSLPRLKKNRMPGQGPVAETFRNKRVLPVRVPSGRRRVTD